MIARVVFIGVGGDSKGSSATDGEVLASLQVLLGIQVGLNEDVDFTLAGPVPVHNLSAKVGDVGKVYVVVGLFKPWSLVRAGVQRRVIIRLSWWWQ